MIQFSEGTNNFSDSRDPLLARVDALDGAIGVERDDPWTAKAAEVLLTPSEVRHAITPSNTKAARCRRWCRWG
jgi:hypothetical protein